MRFNYILVTNVFLLLSCIHDNKIPDLKQRNNGINKPARFPITIASIPLPEGFTRVIPAKNSFGEWLQKIPLNKDNTVYLYNGIKKANQEQHAFVLDMTIGTKNLQQCADAIMKLRALYFYERKEFYKIEFVSTNAIYNFEKHLHKSSINDTISNFESFLETVFINCGTYNLAESLQFKKINTIAIGDVFIKAGAPGHAMIVVDLAKNNSTGEIVFLLAQSFYACTKCAYRKKFE